jgi:hypothetical protein
MFTPPFAIVRMDVLTGVHRLTLLPECPLSTLSGHSAFDPKRTLRQSYSASYLRAMISRQLVSVLFGASLLGACGNREVITDTAPFANLTCQPLNFNGLKRKSTTFAKTERLRYDDADYSVLLTNERLNFILAQVPGTGQVYATGIARSEPTGVELRVFRRFLSDMNLKCVAARD